MIHIVSTGLNVPDAIKAKCRASVAAHGIENVHHYYEAELDNNGPAMAFRWDVISRLHPRDIVVELDGDDWLLPGALEKIAMEYVLDYDLWLTYGSFRYGDGRPGFMHAYKDDDDVRKVPWLATHLKTYRAGLFQRIKREDLQVIVGVPHRQVQWRALAIDLATMFPLLEMAGPLHRKFIKDVLYVYNYGNSYEHNSDPGMNLAEEVAVREIRSMPAYKPLVSL